MIILAIRKIPRILAIAAVFAFSACTVTAESKSLPARPAVSVSSFEECVKAGYPVMRSYPAKCGVPGGQTFVEKIPDTRWNPPTPGATPQATVEYGRDFVRSPGGHRSGGNGFCKDQCGDGTCQEIVCQAQGCPCSESHGTCPKDCK